VTGNRYAVPRKHGVKCLRAETGATRWPGEPSQRDDAEPLRRHERTGRPLGGAGFVEQLEKALGRVLRRQKPGPKPRALGVKYCVPGTPLKPLTRM